MVISTKQQASPFDCSKRLLCLQSCSLHAAAAQAAGGVVQALVLRLCCCCMISTANYMMSVAAGSREEKVQWHCRGAEEDQGAERSHGEPGLRRDTQARLLQALTQLRIRHAAWQQMQPLHDSLDSQTGLSLGCALVGETLAGDSVQQHLRTLVCDTLPSLYTPA